MQIRGIPVSGDMLKVKAREFSNDPNFKASQGWLDNFKTRFAIK